MTSKFKGAIYNVTIVSKEPVCFSRHLLCHCNILQ